MARRSRLFDQDIEELCQHYDFGAVVSWDALDAGTVNSNFAIDAELGRFFLRINEDKSEADVVYETTLVEGLALRGFPTPVPVAGADGRRYVKHNAHLISVFPWQPGEHRERHEVSASDTRSIGRTLRRLHTDAIKVSALVARDGIYTFDRICQRVDELAATSDPAIRESLLLLEDEVAWQRSRSVMPTDRVIIHGDLFRDNVLFEGDQLSAVLDFEQASSGLAIYDLAVCINAWCYDEAFSPRLVSGMIDGYFDQGIDASSAEILLAECRRAAHRFAVTRITDVYLRGENKPEKDFRRYLDRLRYWREQRSVAG